MHDAITAGWVEIYVIPKFLAYEFLQFTSFSYRRERHSILTAQRMYISKQVHKQKRFLRMKYVSLNCGGEIFQYSGFEQRLTFSFLVGWWGITSGIPDRVPTVWWIWGSKSLLQNYFSDISWGTFSVPLDRYVPVQKFSGNPPAYNTFKSTIDRG